MNKPHSTRLAAICDCILNEASSPLELRDALDGFALLCSEISNIHPDPSFDAWAEDSLLDSGVAINPRAAAQCVLDYRRSVVFIRGVYAALGALKSRFPKQSLNILYAGCGPFATLLLPLLGRFTPGELNITLLDIHQRSLDSVNLLLQALELDDHTCHTVRGDASQYRQDTQLELIIAETMQKSLEQEPQFEVTANLAPQLVPGGIFIPELIEVELGLTKLEYEKEFAGAARQLTPDALEHRRRLGCVFSLSAQSARGYLPSGQHEETPDCIELNAVTVQVPSVANIANLDIALFTRITVFAQYRLEDYEAEITLPLKYHGLSPLAPGELLRVSYQLGSYPKFNISRLHTD